MRADGRPDGNRVVNRAGITRLRGLPQERDAVFASGGVEGQNRIARIDGAGLDQLNQRVARTVAADGLARHGDTPLRAEGDEGLEVDQLAQIRRGLGDAPAARQIAQRIQTGGDADARHELTDGGGDILRAFIARVAQAAGLLHQQALTRRRGEGIHQRDIQILDHAGGDQRALHRARKRGGNQNTHHAVARVLRGFKLAQKGVRRGLGGLRVLTGLHALPEDLLRQIHAVGVAVLAEGDGHRDTANRERLQLRLRKIGGGIGDNTNHMLKNPFVNRC